MGLLTKGFTPAMETYLGKSKELIFIEKELDKVVAEIKKHHKPLADDLSKGFTVDGKFTPASIYSMQAFINAEKGLEKFFRLRNLSLTFYHAIPHLLPYMNAFTHPRTLKFLAYDGTGKLDTTKLSIGVNVDFLYVAYGDLTGGELLSVILHEIGHNMDTTIFSYLSHLPGIDVLVSPTAAIDVVKHIFAKSIFDVLGGGWIFSKGLQYLTKFVDETFPAISRLMELGYKAYNEFMSLLGPFNVMSRGIDWTKVFSENYFLSFITPRKLFGYAGEKYADSFVTKYGYGPENQTCHVKLDRQSRSLVNLTLAEIPGVNWCYDLLTLFIRVIVAASDEHPTDIIRINAHVTKLKKDLNDPHMNPRLKKELQNQIVITQKFVDDYIDIDQHGNKKRIFTWMYNYMVIKLFDGRLDYRELFEVISAHDA
jgi:hypothetical protein